MLYLRSQPHLQGTAFCMDYNSSGHCKSKFHTQSLHALVSASLLALVKSMMQSENRRILKLTVSICDHIITL